PAKTAKPTTDKSKTNGVPATDKPSSNGPPVADKSKPNGIPVKPPEPPAIERPPESVEAEALEALADEPNPVEDENPKTIDFTCLYCEAELHLPLDQGGKQLQCPNAECKRIIKVPMPVVSQKKDWRKMERRGPSAAAINMPEQLDDAWGTEEATQARQD